MFTRLLCFRASNQRSERLRVCEPFDWMLEIGEELHVAPRHQVSTFWGPDFGDPDGYKPMHMSTSGGPFKTLKIKELEGLTLVEETEDTFWHWRDVPRSAGNVDYKVKVGDHDRAGRARLLFTVAKRRYRELRALVTTEDPNE